MRPLAIALAPLLAVGLLACGDDGSAPIQPQYEPRIVNATDAFEFQLTDVADASGSLTYGWQNTGTRATIDRASSISAGTVNLTLRDATGAQVYQGTLAGVSGSVATATGVAGAWTIVVDFVHADGTINFRAQKL